MSDLGSHEATHHSDDTIRADPERFVDNEPSVGPAISRYRHCSWFGRRYGEGRVRLQAVRAARRSGLPDQTRGPAQITGWVYNAAAPRGRGAALRMAYCV